MRNWNVVDVVLGGGGKLSPRTLPNTRISTNLAFALTLTIMAGCATRVSVAPTHRENMAAQTKVLAIAARNLEDSVHRHRAEATEEAAARAVAEFHATAENFAGTTARWLSDDRVNADYERLIDAWVKVKQAFPNLKSDNLTQDAYERVQREWEKLARTSGYAGRKYQEKVEQGK